MGTNKIIYLDKEFSATDVKSGNLYQARSPIAASQEIDTFSFDIDSDDTTLTDFIRNTPLTFFHDDEQMGIFYVQKVSRTSINTYHFTCTSTVGLLDETYHDGGIYTGQTVKEVVEDICSPLTVYVKTNIAEIDLYGWLPIATRRENLTQVLFAIGATFKVDFDGAIRIEGLWSGEASEIDASEVYASGSVDYATPVTEVVVTEHAYSQSATETTELFKGTTSAGDKITFDDPCYDLTATGFTILASGANWATVSAGSGVLTGKKYTHVTRQVTQQIKPKTRDLVTQSDNTVKVENATLVSLVNATAVAERLAEYYSHNERINYKIATKREIPGDVVKIAHPYGGTVSGCIESADITVSGKLAADESILIDYFPPDIGSQEYYDTVEVLTQSGTWTVPENVTSIRAVLIGGGSGGSSGCEGENGKNVNGGAGGKGGAAGAGGAGGKVFSAEMAVTPGTNFAVQIGAGGTGGVYSADGSVAGTSGTQTKFGSLSSENGSSSNIGFIDPVNNQTYAQPGDSGVKGGDGGDGGQGAYGVGEAVNGKNGEDASTYTGGKGGGGTYRKSGNSSSNPGQSGASGGGGGGGAAMGNNGSDGDNGDLQWTNFSTSSYQGYGWLAKDGNGGNGGNATIIPSTPSMYGKGGGGGHGGGGGGGGGLTQAVSTWSHSGGGGGSGSNGGDGAPGCVLIYYRVYRASSAGRLVTRDGKQFNERLTRKVVV